MGQPITPSVNQSAGNNEEIAPNVNTVNFNPSNIGSSGSSNGKTQVQQPTRIHSSLPESQQQPLGQQPIKQPIGFSTEFSGGGNAGFTPGRSTAIFDQKQLDQMVKSGKRFKFRGNPGTRFDLDPRFIDQSK